MNRKINKEGRHYKKNKKVNRDTLKFITHRVTKLNISEDDDFKKEYQKIKRINKLVKAAYPFMEFENIEKNRDKLSTIIDVVYKNSYFERILKNKVNGQELSFLEKREYYKSIEYCFGYEFLSKDNEYRNLEEILNLVDNLDEIRNNIENDINIFISISTKTEDKEEVKKCIYEYRDTQMLALSDIREKMMLMELSLRFKNESEAYIKNENKNVDIINCKYYEAKEKLDETINSGNRKIVVIDCMGKSLSEVKKYGLDDVYDDEYILKNFK